jgi:hypothetical protein
VAAQGDWTTAGQPTGMPCAAQCTGVCVIGLHVHAPVACSWVWTARYPPPATTAVTSEASRLHATSTNDPVGRAHTAVPCASPAPVEKADHDTSGTEKRLRHASRQREPPHTHACHTLLTVHGHAHHAPTQSPRLIHTHTHTHTLTHTHTRTSLHHHTHAFAHHPPPMCRLAPV